MTNDQMMITIKNNAKDISNRKIQGKEVDIFVYKWQNE